MRYGHTSMVNFLSRIVMSLSGFVATIALTRTLGRGQYGTYVVVVSVLSWITIAGTLGVPEAVKKRVSEDDEGNYVVSGALAQLVLFGVVAVCLLAARPYLNDFVGIAATGVLIIMLAARLAFGFVRTVLDGQRLVHVSSVLSPVELTSRSVVQVALVLTGFSLTGAFAGYVVGSIVAALIGAYFIGVPSTLPSRRDFARLKSYAQFSWLDSIKGRTFLSMDTLILAFFVSHSLVAVYEVTWNLASLFAIFSRSISRTLFPEMSKLASEEGASEEIAGLLRVSLAYSGLFVIPGLVGAAIVGDVVLTVYGPGFEQGYYILLVLTVARLLYGYMGQFITTINALDRPDFTFYINAVFVALNLVLNVALTWRFGWYGAAAATTASAGVALLLGYHYASRIVDVVVPVGEIAKQCLAAGIMATAVLAGRVLVGDSLLVVVVLVGVGGAVYFVTLFGLSREFRGTVRDNLPARLSTFVPR